MEPSNTGTLTKDEVPAAAPTTSVVPKPTVSAKIEVAKAVDKRASKVAVKPVSSKKSATKPKSTAVKVTAKPVGNASPNAVKAKAAKVKKVKMVRDSISIPKTEFQALVALKTRAGKLGVEVKKTELIRAGIKILASLTDTSFAEAMRTVPNLKNGRPAKSN
jgi:hypothetical protein